MIELGIFCQDNIILDLAWKFEFVTPRTLSKLLTNEPNRLFFKKKLNCHGFVKLIQKVEYLFSFEDKRPGRSFKSVDKLVRVTIEGSAVRAPQAPSTRNIKLKSWPDRCLIRRLSRAGSITRHGLVTG